MNLTTLTVSLVCPPNLTWNGVSVSKDALHLLIFPCPQNVTGECFSSAQKHLPVYPEAWMVCFIWNNPSALNHTDIDSIDCGS